MLTTIPRVGKGNIMAMTQIALNAMNVFMDNNDWSDAGLFTMIEAIMEEKGYRKGYYGVSDVVEQIPVATLARRLDTWDDLISTGHPVLEKWQREQVRSHYKELGLWNDPYNIHRAYEVARKEAWNHIAWLANTRKISFEAAFLQSCGDGSILPI